MARLMIKSDGFQNQVIELKLGATRLGRSPENDFQVEHPTVSATHCEVQLGDGEIIVRDCDSTNGTFVGGEQIGEARLLTGESFWLGDVEFFVETTEVTIAIPEFEVPSSQPAPPVVLADGSLICPRHPRAHATHQCTHCKEVLCDACVHHMRRRGGKTLKLCPVCSHKCERIGGEKKKKKSLLGFLSKTVKLPLFHSSKGAEKD